MENKDTVLYIVIPCYNEEDTLKLASPLLNEKLSSLINTEKISPLSRILFVNDGSTDSTWEIIENLHKESNLFSGINLSRNRGHQNAILAGLMTAKERADIVISMDADLQDDINAIDEMIDKYYGGCDIVYGVRSSRKKGSMFKKNSARQFYRFMKRMGIETVCNHADFRLMSRRALNALEQFKEKNLFLRGIVPLIGFKSDKVYYERNERIAGESKYSLRKMIGLAVDAVTSFSIRPIRMITVLGFLIFLTSIALTATFIVKWALDMTVVGWPTIVCSIWAIGGLIMLSLGIIGEYVGKIYMETKARPSFIIESLLDD